MATIICFKKIPTDLIQNTAHISIENSTIGEIIKSANKTCDIVFMYKFHFCEETMFGDTIDSRYIETDFIRSIRESTGFSIQVDLAKKLKDAGLIPKIITTKSIDQMDLNQYDNTIFQCDILNSKLNIIKIKKEKI